MQLKQIIYKHLQRELIRYITKYVLNTKTDSLKVSHNIEKQLQLIYKTQGKKTFNKLLKQNINNFPTLVLNPDYYWSNLDLWILATKEKIPIILITKSYFPELSHLDVKDKKILLLSLSTFSSR